MSGRGRGVSNEPAWMSKQRAENGGGPGGPGGGPGPGPPGGGPGGGGGPPHRRSRSRSRDRDGGGNGGGGDRDPFGRVRSGGPPPPRDGGPRGDRDGGRYGYGPGPPGGGGFRGGGGGPPPPPGRRGRSPSRGGGGRRGRSPPGRGGGGGGGGGGGNRSGIYFRSFEEERAWVEDRRRRRRERKSLFDVEPTPEQLEMERAQEAAKAAMAASGAPGAAPGGVYGPGAGTGGGAAPPRRPRLPASSQPQQTRHARRIYVGHLPPDLTEDQVHSFFREAIAKAMGHDDPRAVDDPILSVYVNPERRFAFIEFKTMEICTASMALDGINVLGRGKVKVKRPNDYNPALAPEPNPASLPKFDISRLGIVSGTVPDGPNKLFIGGLPYHLTEENCLELLGAFGAVRAFHLVKADPTATTNKGYGFVEYVDPAVTPVAVMGLNGMDMGGGKQLSARMAATRADPAAGAGAAVPGVLQQQPGGVAMVQQQQQQPGAAAYGAAVPGAAPAAVAAAPVNGVDVEALLNAAMGGAAAPMPAAVAPAAPLAAYQPQQQLQQQQPAVASLPMPAVAQIADAALDAAFGPSAGSGAPPPPAPAAVPQPMAMAAGAGAVPHQQQQQLSAVPLQQQQAKTKILVLLNMVADEDLATDEDHSALFDEVREECAKFGRLVSMKIPRPQDGHAPTAVKKIFLEYATVDDASKAEGELAGRQFGPNVVQTTYFLESDYAANKLY